MTRILCCSAICILAATAAAADVILPPEEKPIRIIVPFAGGGPTDTLARIMAPHLGASLGTPVVVENVIGASGAVAGARVARAAPDGYTVGIGSWGTHVINGAALTLQYDLLRDFEPVALIASTPLIVVSRNGVPAADLSGLIAWLKTDGGKASARLSGPGLPSHVAGVFFQKQTGTRFQFVPYGGAGAALQDLMAGQIDLMFDQVSSAIAHVKEGKIRAYAVAAGTRSPAAADIPTVDEAGLPGYYVSVWHALWMPKGTPKPVVARLNAAVTGALADPAVRGRFADIGQEIPPRDQQTPAALRVHHKAEIKKWWPVIKAANIKAE